MKKEKTIVKQSCLAANYKYDLDIIREIKINELVRNGDFKILIGKKMVGKIIKVQIPKKNTEDKDNYFYCEFIGIQNKLKVEDKLKVFKNNKLYYTGYIVRVDVYFGLNDFIVSKIWAYSLDEINKKYNI